MLIPLTTSRNFRPIMAKRVDMVVRYCKSPWEFRQRGESGLWISDLFPEVAAMADDLTLIRSMQCDQPVHPGAMTQMHTGTAQFIRPSLGAWTLYGLGTENESLPGFVSLSPPSGSARNYGSAFLPAIYGGAKVGRGGRSSRVARFGNGESVPDIKPSMTKAQQRLQLDYIQKLNQGVLEKEQYQPDVEGIIESYELAFRMQDAMPEVMDVSKKVHRPLSFTERRVNQHRHSDSNACLHGVLPKLVYGLSR